MQQHVCGVQADAGYQNRSDGHDGDRLAGRELHANQRSLVATEQPVDAREYDRIDVEGITRKIRDVFDAAGVRRVEAVVHAGRESQCHITTALERRCPLTGAEQLVDPVWRSLCLVESSRDSASK
jgi:hypothetical protein